MVNTAIFERFGVTGLGVVTPAMGKLFIRHRLQSEERHDLIDDSHGIANGENMVQIWTALLRIADPNRGVTNNRPSADIRAHDVGVRSESQGKAPAQIVGGLRHEISPPC